MFGIFLGFFRCYLLLFCCYFVSLCFTLFHIFFGTFWNVLERFRTKTVLLCFILYFHVNKLKYKVFCSYIYSHIYSHINYLELFRTKTVSFCFILFHFVSFCILQSFHVAGLFFKFCYFSSCSYFLTYLYLQLSSYSYRLSIYTNTTDANRYRYVRRLSRKSLYLSRN